MPTNKHAAIRYNALDRCFSNFGRKYYIEDLVEACNKALYDFSGIEDGVRRRQVLSDINFMMSDEGWSVPLLRIRDGRRVYFRYADKNYSISTIPVRQNELESLKDAISTFSRFKGLPQFGWVDELAARVDQLFDISYDNSPQIGFEENPYLKGLNFFADILSAVKHQKVLRILYLPYKKTEPALMKIHPYYLKQYNSRWFLFGYNQDFGTISNLAIDRIEKVSAAPDEFIPNTDTDFEEYFDDVVGVTVDPTGTVSKVVFRATESLAPYIKSKPVHGSQRLLSENEDGSTTFQLSVQINYELVSQLFAFMDGITVESPKELRKSISDKLKKAIENYS
jgi:hypothetical protein